MRVATFPDWREANPYQRLLAEALAPLGVELTFPRGYRRGLPFSRQVLRRPLPHVLHLHWPTPFLRAQGAAFRAAYCVRTLLDLALVQRAGIKIVWTVHNLVTHDTPTPRLERWFSARLARLADRLICHSDAAADEVVAQLNAPREKIAIIPHGSFAPAYGPPLALTRARIALDMPQDVPIALFFGLIRPYKGVINLLRAWEALGVRRGAARLFITGQALDLDYAAQVQELAVSIDGVNLDLRRVPDAEIPALMSAVDLVVLPFQNSLTSGTVRLACDYGCRVVVPNVVGAYDIPGAILAVDTGPEALGAAIMEGFEKAPRIPFTRPLSDWPAIAAAHKLVYSTCR